MVSGKAFIVKGTVCGGSVKCPVIVAAEATPAVQAIKAAAVSPIFPVLFIAASQKVFAAVMSNRRAS